MTDQEIEAALPGGKSMSDEELLAIAAKYVRDSSDPYYTFDSLGLLALLHEVLRQSGHARP